MRKEMDGKIMKKPAFLMIIILALIVSGCNYPGYEQPVDEDEDTMATEIAKILTGTPVEIQLSPTADIDQEEPDAAPDATDTPEPAVQEDTPTPTTTFTPTITLTPTLSDTDPVLTLGTPDWVDTMANGNNWYTVKDIYTSVKVEDGFLKLTAESDLYGWRLSWPFLEDFYLEAKIQSPKCEGNDHYGVMFRVPNVSNPKQGYLFAITCDGRYSLLKWDDPKLTFIENWTSHESIKKGADTQNTLGIMAKGSNIALYINGVKVKETSDNAFSAGGFGFFVKRYNVQNLSLWADQIRYWENP